MEDAGRRHFRPVEGLEQEHGPRGSVQPEACGGVGGVRPYTESTSAAAHIWRHCSALLGLLGQKEEEDPPQIIQNGSEWEESTPVTVTGRRITVQLNLH